MMKEMSCKEELYESALQEAAHAVVATSLGFRVTSLKRSHGEVRCFVVSQTQKVFALHKAEIPEVAEANQDWMLRFGALTLARAAASVVYRGEYIEEWGSDVGLVMRILSKHAKQGPTCFVLTCFHMAKQHLEQKWDAVEFLAQALFYDGQVSGGLVKSVVENSMPRAS